MTDPKEPSRETLKKYGLTADLWWAILIGQGNVCAICEQESKTGRYVVDHEHTPKWKKQPPEFRRSTIRGILCWWCNKNYVGRSITIAKARNVVTYLERYQARVISGRDT